MKTGFFGLFWVLCLFPAALHAVPKLEKKIATEVVKEFNKEPRKVRTEAELLPVGYVEIGGKSYAYTIPRRFVRLALDGDSFRIDKIRYRDTCLQLRLESGRGARVEMFVHDDDLLGQAVVDSVLPAVLADVFHFRGAIAGSRFLGNRASRVIHIRGCNHLPRPADRVDLESVAKAVAEGFRTCPVCFAEEAILPIENYGPLRARAVEDARLLELAFPPVSDPALQDSIQRTGDRILENLPLTPKGFDYVFKVIHSEIPNAYSIPTGFVFVTDQLVRAIEDPAELEFVLAHEIVHTEMNRRVDETILIGTADVVTAELLRRQERLRFREIESDLLALSYLVGTGSDPDRLARARAALSKLMFASEVTPVEDDRFSSHPAFSRRLAFFDPQRFRTAASKTFCGLDENGEVLARARLIGRREMSRAEYEKSRRPAGSGWVDDNRAEGRMYYYLHLEVTDLVEKPARQAQGTIEDATGKHIVFEKWRLPFPIDPGESGILELGPSPDLAALSDIRQLRLDAVDGVKRWEACKE